MRVINKQKFLAELGKLLTFMYEEDRQLALAMYSEMFDEAANEQDLIQKLVSPTRQAVLVARSYNAKTRGLAVNAKFGTDNAEAGSQAFVETIENIRSDVLAAPEEDPFVDENQLSMFDEDPMAVIAAEAEDEDEETEDEPEEVPVEEPASPEEPVLDEIVEDAAEEIQEVDSVEEAEDENVPAEEVADPNVSEESERVAEFLSSYVSPVEEEEPAEEFSAVEVPEEPEEDDSDYEVEELLSGAKESSLPTTVRKPRVFLLILYTLISIPLCLIVSLLLVIPTVLCLGIAGTSILCGVAACMAAFSGFAVIADLLVAIGASVVLLAIGLLFLWAAIWFVFGAIIGFIRGDVRLGRKWCYKEVEIDG